MHGFRIFAALMAVLPLALILGLGSSVWRVGNSAGSAVVARPPSWAFTVAWVVVTVCWLAAQMYAAFRFEFVALIPFVVFSALALVIALLWEWLYASKGRKYTANGLLILLLLFAFGMLCSCFGSKTTVPRMAVAFLVLPLIVWSIVAFQIGSSELQVERQAELQAAFSQTS